MIHVPTGTLVGSRPYVYLRPFEDKHILMYYFDMYGWDATAISNEYLFMYLRCYPHDDKIALSLFLHGLKSEYWEVDWIVVPRKAAEAAAATTRAMA